MKSSRFTVSNDDTSNIIYISNSLKSKLLSSSEPPKATTSVQSAPIAPVCQDPVSAIESDDSKSMPNSIPYEEISSKYADQSSCDLGQSEPFYGDAVSALRYKYESQLKNYRKAWLSRFKQMEQLNERLLKQNSAKFASEVNHLESKHFQNSSKYFESPCQTVEVTLRQCYLDNPKKPLLCSQEVKQFAECIRQASIDFVKRE